MSGALHWVVVEFDHSVGGWCLHEALRSDQVIGLILESGFKIASDEIGNVYVSAPGRYFHTALDLEWSNTPWVVRKVVSSILDAAEFRRGDCNDDATVDISDAVSTLGALFLGDGDPGCDDACDSNDDGVVDISDAINTLVVKFLGNGVIPLPGMTACGFDPTPDEVGCDTYNRCP